MENFFSVFVDWINKNKNKLKDLFSDEFKIYDIAQQIYGGDLGYAMMYNNPDIPNEVDWEACWATEDFAPVFYWFNQKYNKGNFNPTFDRNEIIECYHSYDVYQEIYKTNPQKWEMLAKKVALLIGSKNNILNYYLIKECKKFYDGFYDESSDEY